MLKVTQQTPKN